MLKWKSKFVLVIFEVVYGVDVVIVGVDVV